MPRWIHSKLQLLYLSVQQSQSCNQLKPISILNMSEIASIACLLNFSGPALLSCSEILTYQLLGSQLWIALPLKNSRSLATAMINRAGANCAITHELSFV